MFSTRMDCFLKYWMDENYGYAVVNDDKDWWNVYNSIAQITVTMHPDTRDAFFAGNVPERYRDLNPKYETLRRALYDQEQAAVTHHKWSIIYANFLVDRKSSFSPTYEELTVILTDFERYF